jgi:integrase
MSVYLRGKVYYVETTILGVGIVKKSTGVKDKKLARQMEAALSTLASSGWADLVQDVQRGTTTLPELWQARLEGDASLLRMRERKGDPLLADVVAERLPLVTDERVKTGYEQLRDLAPAVESSVARATGRRPEPVRLSWLLRPQNVTALYEASVASGKRPNTVRRSLHRAVADLITRRYSRGKMLAVMADAIVPGENDERVVWLSHEEVQRLLAACDVEFRPIVGLALTTGIDRKPMLTARVAHYDAELGQLSIPDTKTGSRPRQVILRGTPLLENAEGWLRELVAGKGPTDPLVQMTVSQLRTRWEAVAKKIGRDDMRWKDLRGCFATYALLAGNSVRDVQFMMGHSTTAMTVRYVRRVPVGNKDSLQAAARTVGVYKPDLRMQAGGAA